MKLQLDAAAQQFGNRVAQTYANERGDGVPERCGWKPNHCQSVSREVRQIKTFKLVAVIAIERSKLP